MNNWQDRVITEQQELAGKYKRLCEFIDSEKINNLAVTEQLALGRQARVMRKYLGILTERMARFE